MVKRVLKLPERGELTKDQRKVLSLPANGQYLVVGAPGTGKSVVALYRLKELGDSSSAVFLTFNHVLAHANKSLLNPELAMKTATAMSWLYDYHWQLVGGRSETFNQVKLPEVASHKPDYVLVKKRFSEYKADLSNASFIIDEEQDLPSGWYDCVEGAGLENFFVVADQNQQITDERSSMEELQDALGIGNNEDVIELKQNWRNTTPIAAFSNWFYTDKSSPKPELPKGPSSDIPTLYEYETIDRVKEQILSEFDLDPSKLIGFIVSNEGKREWWVNSLMKDDKLRSNSKPVVSTYSSSLKENVNIDFGYGGIVLLNDKSVKGIEFDTVFILMDGFKAIANDEV